MENLNSVWQIGLIALIAGTLIGALAYRLFSTSKSKTEQIRTELDQTRDELAAYKASVQSHFDKTSELVNELTQNYARVYQHLAEGAHTLGDSQALNNLLEQQQGRVLIAVGDEVSEDNRLADEMAAAQAQASMDVPLGDAVAEDGMDVAIAADDTARGKQDDLKPAAAAGQDAGHQTQPVVDPAGQVAWEPASPGTDARPLDTEPAADESATANSAETAFDATQKFIVGEETGTEPADSATPATAAGDTVGQPKSKGRSQKSKPKETETA